MFKGMGISCSSERSRYVNQDRFLNFLLDEEFTEVRKTSGILKHQRIPTIVQCHRSSQNKWHTYQTPMYPIGPKIRVHNDHSEKSQDRRIKGRDFYTVS